MRKEMVIKLQEVGAGFVKNVPVSELTSMVSDSMLTFNTNKSHIFKTYVTDKPTGIEYEYKHDIIVENPEFEGDRVLVLGSDGKFYFRPIAVNQKESVKPTVQKVSEEPKVQAEVVAENVQVEEPKLEEAKVEEAEVTPEVKPTAKSKKK